MISVNLDGLGATGEEVFSQLFKTRGVQVDVDKVAEYMAMVLLSRVKRRFRKQENPDGSTWPISKDAMIRAAGGETFAEGGRFAPGGWKTGGHTLFSSGNLYHSIQLVHKSTGVYSVRTDVPYGVYYMKYPRIIIGTSPYEFETLASAAVGRLL